MRGVPLLPRRHFHPCIVHNLRNIVCVMSSLRKRPDKLNSATYRPLLFAPICWDSHAHVSPNPSIDAELLSYFSLLEREFGGTNGDLPKTIKKKEEGKDKEEIVPTFLLLLRCSPTFPVGAGRGGFLNLSAGPRAVARKHPAQTERPRQNENAAPKKQLPGSAPRKNGPQWGLASQPTWRFRGPKRQSMSES